MNESPQPHLTQAVEYLRRALETDNPVEREWNRKQADLHRAEYEAQAAKKKRRKIANASRRANRR